MKIVVDALIIIGMVLALLGVASKLAGTSIIAPVIAVPVNYFIVANFCLLVALIIDFKAKK